MDVEPALLPREDGSDCRVLFQVLACLCHHDTLDTAKTAWDYRQRCSFVTNTALRFGGRGVASNDRERTNRELSLSVSITIKRQSPDRRRRPGRHCRFAGLPDTSNRQLTDPGHSPGVRFSRCPVESTVPDQASDAMSGAFQTRFPWFAGGLPTHPMATCNHSPRWDQDGSD
jgi:hypothetical protein